MNSTFISHTEKLSLSNNSSDLSIVIDWSLQGKSFRQNKSLSSLYGIYMKDPCFDKMDLSTGINSKE